MRQILVIVARGENSILLISFIVDGLGHDKMKDNLVLHARLSNLFNKILGQMTILTVFGNLHFSLK